jgi:cysteine desulfurase
MSDKRIVYLDHNATTAVAPDVLEAMLPYFTGKFANPMSIYSISQDNRKAVEDARERISRLLGAGDGRIVFSGCGSESDNQAIIGFAMANRAKGKHIVTSSIEHHAVLNSCKYLQKQGFEITYLPVTNDGLVRPSDLEKAMTSETILVSIMFANNETGVVEPIEELAKVAHAHNAVFHTDAVQAVGKLPIDVSKMGIDLLTASAHKFYGPKGVGILYANRKVRLDPIIHGGEQEKGLRAGTENVPGIVGIAAALEKALADRESETSREKTLRDRLERELLARIPESFANGAKAERLSNTTNITIKYIEGESMLLFLNASGICVSSGSACTSGSLEPSHVLLAMGVPAEHAHGSLRFSFGRDNTDADVDAVIEKLPAIVERLRAMSPVWEDHLKEGR